MNSLIKTTIVALWGALLVMPASADWIGSRTVYSPFNPYNHDVYSGHPYRASPMDRAEEVNRLYSSYFGVAPTIRLDPIEPDDPDLPPPPPEVAIERYRIDPSANDRLYDSRYESAFDRYPRVPDYYVAPEDGSPSYIVTDRTRRSTTVLGDRAPQLEFASAEMALREPRHPDNPLDADNWRMLYSRGVSDQYDANVGYGQRNFRLYNPNPYSAHGLDNPNYWNDRQSTEWGHHRFDARFYRDDTRRAYARGDLRISDEDGLISGGAVTAGGGGGTVDVHGDSRFVFDKYDQLYSPYGHGPAELPTATRHETLRMPTEAYDPAYDREAAPAYDRGKTPAHQYPPNVRVPSGRGGPAHDSRDLPRIHRDGGDPHRGPYYDFDGVIEVPPQDRRIPDHDPLFDLN